MLRGQSVAGAYVWAVAGANLPRVEVPVSERLCRQVVSLPLYPELREDEAEQVVEAVLA